jgi:hypothetical protein
MIIQVVARERRMAAIMKCGMVPIVSGAISSTFMLKMFYRMGKWGQRGWRGGGWRTATKEAGRKIMVR